MGVVEQAPTRRKRAKVTAEMDAYAAELCGLGRRMADIGAAIGCCATSAAAAARRGGAEPAKRGRRPRPVPAEVADAIVTAYGELRSCVRTTARVNEQACPEPPLTTSVVKRVLRESGVRTP